MLARFSDAELALGVVLVLAALMLLTLAIASLYLPRSGGTTLAESFQGRFAPRRPVQLSLREQVLLRRLRVAFPECNVLPHLDLHQVVSVLPTGVSAQGASALTSRIQGVQLGFLVCASDMEPLLAVELLEDDTAFERSRLGDLDKSAALKSAGIPLITVRSSSMPTPAQLAVLLEARPHHTGTL
jgi:hypothetical protein